MDHHPDPVQALLLWNLAANKGSAWLADLKSTLTDKSRRDLLIQSGLISEQKCPRVRAGGRTVRATQLTLEEKGWAWLADHLDAPISQSKAAADVLQLFLAAMQAHLDRHNLALADFMSLEPAEDAEPPSPHQPPTAELDEPQPIELTASRIATIYASLTQNRSNHRVKLADVRRELSDLARADVDAALQRMASDGIIVLGRLDNPLEITAEDETAKLLTGLGDPRHIMHMEIHAYV
jgi:hypothetical protein